MAVFERRGLHRVGRSVRPTRGVQRALKYSGTDTFLQAS
jgi:hypothetical protein